MMRTIWSLLLAILVTGGLSGCGYNTLQVQDEAIKAGWSEVLNQYQRRADLVPNLVNTVKGYAAHEQGVFLIQRDRISIRSRQVGAAITVDLQ